MAKVRGFTLLLLVLAGFSSSPAVQAFGLCDTAKPIGVNTTSGVITHTTGFQDFYKITAPSDGLLTVLHQSNSSLITTYYDKDCFIISDPRSFVNSVPVKKGVNFVSKSSTTATAYKVQVDGDFANDDHGVSCTSATVARSLNETGKMGPYADRDFFQVNLVGAGLLQAGVQSNSAILRTLYDKNCLVVSPTRSFDISGNFAPGIYYVAVSEGDGNNSTGNYNLNLSGNIQFPTGTCAGKAATISGTNSDDVIKGTAGNDVIQAGTGNDVVYGLTGDDTLCGGDGDDVIIGSDGNDKLSGENGNDILQGGNGTDALDGGVGSDTCDGGLLTDTGTGCEVFNLIP